MSLFARENDILRGKLAFEAKTGLNGAVMLFDLYNLLRFDMIFDFKLSLEFRFILDFHLIFNFDFDIDLPAPHIPPRKAYYGMAMYDLDSYDPEIPPSPYQPIVVEVFRGPDAWKEKAFWNLTYKYTMHDRYYYNQPLDEAQKRSKAYSEYFIRSPEYEVTGGDMHYTSRATEFIYTAACWFDFNSFDIGRFWPTKVPLRVPRAEADELVPHFDQSVFDRDMFDMALMDVPFHNFDMFDSARFDSMLRRDIVIWVTDPFMTTTRFNLAAFDAAIFDVLGEGNTNMSIFLANSNVGRKMQAELDDYKLRSDPLVAGTIWAITSDRFRPNWVRHGVRMHRNAVRISHVLDQNSILDRLGYQGFAREWRTRDTTLGRATAEQVIEKYVKLGLSEPRLRRIGRMVEFL